MDKLLHLIEQHKFRKAESLLRILLEEKQDDVYLLTQLANVLWNMHKDNEALIYAKDAFEEMRDDPLVIYTYAVALKNTDLYNESLKQFRALKDLGIDYITYSEHGEGKVWAKKLLSDSERHMRDITETQIKIY